MNTQTNQTNPNKLADAMQRAIDGGKTRPTYRVAGMKISMAKPTSVNPGWLYVKNEYDEYLGKISPTGEMRMGAIDAFTKTTLLSAIHAPEATAMNEGKETGQCCCCGRILTNPLSIELGIGPICREGWFPAASSPLGDLGQLVPAPAAQLYAQLVPAAQDDLDISLDALAQLASEQIEAEVSEARVSPLPIYLTPEEEGQLEIQEIVAAFARLDTGERLDCLCKIVLIKEKS
jgi:hypothetical protein